MPRDGSGIYTKPFPNVVEGTTIESAVHNGIIADVETDLNWPRPVIAGGTGANNDFTARTNLKAERAMQPVTNYDSHTWEAGSFFSQVGATGAPNPTDAFVGVASGDTVNMAIVAHAIASNAAYLRKRLASAWGAWILQKSAADDLDAAYVNTTGDTMSGALTIARSGPQLILNKTDGNASNANIFSQSTGNVRWSLNMAAGADFDNFYISRWSDAGTGTNVLRLIRASGDAVFEASLNVTGGLTVTGATNTAAMNVAGALNVTGVSGSVTAHGGTIVTKAGAAAGDSQIIWQDFAGTNKATLSWVAADHSFVLNNLAAPEPLKLSFDSKVTLAKGFHSRGGFAGPNYAYVHNFNYYGPLEAWVDTTMIGNVTVTSDYRTKADVQDLPAMWDTVKALRPVSYTHADWTPAWELDARTKAAAEKGEEVTPFFTGDNEQWWGFVAHELQDTLIPTAATGHKDAEGIIQSPNIFVVVAALTKALQEAMARIEVLESIVQPT